MSWREGINSPQIDRNDDGTISVTRRCIVWDYARDAIVMNPSSIERDPSLGPPTRLLEVNDIGRNTLEVPDPNNPLSTITVIAYEISLNPYSLISEVEIRYSNDPRLVVSDQADGPLTSYKGRSGAFQAQDEVIPYAQLVYETPKGAANQESVWTEVHEPWPSKVSRRSYSLLIPNTTAFFIGYVNACEKNQNKIHQFGTGAEGDPFEYLLFNGYDYAHYSPRFLLFTLFWLKDAGLSDVFFENTSSLYFPPKNKQWPQEQGVNYIRPPYHVLRMSPIPAGATGAQIEWYTYTRFAIVGPEYTQFVNGGKTLIGSGITLGTDRP